MLKIVSLTYRGFFAENIFDSLLQRIPAVFANMNLSRSNMNEPPESTELKEHVYAEKKSDFMTSQVSDPAFLHKPKKMRILIIHNTYQQKGGEDVVFQMEDEILTQNGNEVETLVFDNKEIQTLKDKISLGLGCIYNFKSAREVKKKILAFKPDIIHVHNFFPIASPSVFFVAKKYNVPVVVTLHNYRLLCPSVFLFFNHAIYEESIHKIFPLDPILKGVYRNSPIQTAFVILMTGIHKLIGTWRNKIDKFIILTDFAKQKFVNSSLHLSAEQLVVKPNFMDDLGSGPEKRADYFLFVGRLSEEKGIKTLLEASKLFDFKLKIIGEGPLQSEVEQHAAEHPQVEYLGFRKKKFIIEELKQSKALLFTSVWYEGFPMTILEAFASGTPVITSQLGGPGDIVQDRVNGLHFKAGDPTDLVKQIKQLYQDEKLVVRLSRNARETYLTHYTPEINYKLLMGVYEEVIQRKLSLPIGDQP